MTKIITSLVLFVAALVPAFATTRSVPAFTSASIQSTVNSSSAGDIVSLPAGTYAISSQISVPCGITITGPVANPATAILNASFSNVAIFSMGGCSNNTFLYMKSLNTGFLYSNGTTNNILVSHNQFGGLPSTTSGGGTSSAAIYVDGYTNTGSNWTITFNTFGDSNSCTAVYTVQGDLGGYCAGIYEQNVNWVNGVVQFNTFNHVEEGLHWHQQAGSFAVGNPQSYVDGGSIQYNYFTGWHRIAVEIQTGVINHTISVSDNVFQNPLGVNYGTFAVSMACCNSGSQQGLASGIPNPAQHSDNNLLITNTHTTQFNVNDCADNATNRANHNCYFQNPEFGFEFWGGAGSTTNNNWIFGPWAGSIQWGYGVSPWYIQNNYICRQPPNPAADGSTQGFDTQGYILNEEGQSNTPTISGNTTVVQCSQQISTAPTLTASQTFSGTLGVVITNTGRNTSSYYTTDGTTPVPGQGTTQLYTGPISISATTTVKAVGMWGTGPQPTSYPAQVGFAPSAVVSAAYTLSGSAPPPPPPSSGIFGNNTTSGTGVTYANAINALYVAVAPGTSVTINQLHQMILSPVTSGKHYQLLVVSAPTPTTMASSALCSAVYTTSGTTAPGTVANTPTTCPAITGGTSGTGYWIMGITDDPANSGSGGTQIGWNNCGGTCTGGVPTNGVGTYPGRWLSITYASSYTFPSTFSGSNSGQPVFWADVTTTVVNPTITGGSLSTPGSINTLQVGASPIPFTVNATYSDGTPRTVPDSFGNTANWSVTSTSVLSVTTSGVVSCVGAGTANVVATISPTAPSISPWTMTCTAPPPTLSSIVLAPTNVTLQVGQTANVAATCNLSNGTVGTCPSLVYGTTDATKATISGSGVITAVAAGSVTASASASGITSNAVAVTVQTAPTTLASITLTAWKGAVKIVNGHTLQFSAVCVDSTGATVTCPALTYFVLDPTLATVSGNVVTANLGVTGTVYVQASGGGILSSQPGYPIVPTAVQTESLTICAFDSCNVKNSTQGSSTAPVDPPLCSVIAGNAYASGACLELVTMPVTFVDRQYALSCSAFTSSYTSNYSFLAVPDVKYANGFYMQIQPTIGTPTGYLSPSEVDCVATHDEVSDQ